MSVSLRSRTLADLPELWRWLYDAPDAEWKRWDAPYLSHALPELSYGDYVAGAISRPPTSDMQVIEIGGQARGMVTRSWEAPEEGGWLDLGIVIYDPAFWNGGHGTEALRLWTARCFEETPAHLLTLTTWSGNARMLASARKAGYRECARIPEARLYQGERYDSVKLARLRREQTP